VRAAARLILAPTGLFCKSNAALHLAVCLRDFGVPLKALPDSGKRAMPLSCSSGQILLKVKVMSRLRVYIVDDNTFFSVAATRFLSDFCAAEVVGVARSAEDALRCLEGLRPDLVLLDQNMAGMSGLEAAERIMRGPCAPSVVIVSLNATTQLRQEALKAGCEGLVSKIDFTAEMPPLIEAVSSRRRHSSGAMDRRIFRCDSH